jgi:hypothetical protein
MTAKLAAAAVGTLILLASTPSYAALCPGPANKQVCCSARSCSGRILSNRDRHNCKVKSHGKSWHAKGGSCVNL